MDFGREDVRRIAALARLQLTGPELDRFAAQLGSVLDHVAALDAPPAESPDPAEAASRLRRDVPAADALVRPPADFAPAFVEGFFTVPRMQAFDRDTPGSDP